MYREKRTDKTDIKESEPGEFFDCLDGEVQSRGGKQALFWSCWQAVMGNTGQ